MRVGPVLRAGPLELPLHVGVELGGLRGAGTGGDWNYTADTLWAAVMVGAGLAWAPRRLRGYAAPGVLAEVALLLHSPQFVFDGDLPVHRIVAEETVEEKMLDLHQRKRALAATAIEDLHEGGLSREDLLELLR